MHSLPVVALSGPKWEFNGNIERPTFTPSLLITTGHYTSRHKPGDECWCTYNLNNPDEPSPFRCSRCHLFLTDGQLRFLEDCTHELKGQTIPLPEIPE